MLPIYLLSGKKKPKGGIQGLLNRCSLRTQQPRLLTADLVSASPPSELKKQSVPFSHTSMSLESQLAAALQVFSAANAFDIDLMASVLDDSVRWLMRPESISGGSSDGISKAEYIVFAANMKNMVAVPGVRRKRRLGSAGAQRSRTSSLMVSPSPVPGPRGNSPRT